MNYNKFIYDINYRIAHLYKKYDNVNNISFEDFKYWYTNCQSRVDEIFFENLEQKILKEIEEYESNMYKIYCNKSCSK